MWLKVIAIFSIFVTIFGLPTSNDPRSLIRENSLENIEKLKNLRGDENAELLSGQYQGDIVMTDEEIRELESKKSNKAGLIASRYIWAGAVVPFRIIESHFTPAQIEHIHLGTKIMERETCLRFVPYNPAIHNDFVTVTGSASGCFSSVGRRGVGEQILNLQPSEVGVGCFRIGTVMHEFIHAIGFYHMHSATERDDYVEIVWDKIRNDTVNNFVKYEANVISNYGVEYDYGSVMHYPTVSFSIDGMPTIIPKKPLDGQVMGQRLEMSAKDIERLNNAYCSNLPDKIPHPVAVKVKTFVSNLLSNIFNGLNM